MDFVTSPIPSISISPAPPPEPIVEPTSPFSWAVVPENDDAFRQQHLTPPLVISPNRGKQLSPLRPEDAPVTGKGLERERFEALLKASKERNVAVGAKRACDLRKEIALKAHKNKQLERRALFLSKVQAPPSPTATSLPKTPPESPAIFHYTLPSPGLQSPLALFDSLANDDHGRGPISSHEPWVEQVIFRIPEDEMKPKKSSRVGGPPASPLPSLDQITARLRAQRTLTKTEAASKENRPSTTLFPAFLSSNIKRATQPASSLPTETHTRPRPMLPLSVGRLQMPVRALPITAPKPLKAEGLRIIPPNSPCSPLTPNLQITTTLISRTSTTSPTELTETNLQRFDSRSRRAKDMLLTLKRRTVSLEDGVASEIEDERKCKSRRQSAPAVLQRCSRPGFEHSVLALPGGF